MNTKREIKFRVWDTKYLEFSNYTNRDPHFDVSSGKLFFWEKTREEDGSYGGDIILEDLGDRFILQQYIGLTDSKGVDVYEGDIIEAGNGIVYLCEYSEDEAGYILKYKDRFVYLSDFNTLKVIGNIFENPELLKQ